MPTRLSTFAMHAKKEIPQRDLQIIDFDAGPNWMFIKPFHFDCVPIYYRDRNDIEEERQEERKRKEKEHGRGDYPPDMRIHWGKLNPRLINQSPLLHNPRELAELKACWLPW